MLAKTQSTFEYQLKAYECIEKIIHLHVQLSLNSSIDYII